MLSAGTIIAMSKRSSTPVAISPVTLFLSVIDLSKRLSNTLGLIQSIFTDFPRSEKLIFNGVSRLLNLKLTGNF